MSAQDSDGASTEHACPGCSENWVRLGRATGDLVDSMDTACETCGLPRCAECTAALADEANPYRVLHTDVCDGNCDEEKPCWRREAAHEHALVLYECEFCTLSFAGRPLSPAWVAVAGDAAARTAYVDCMAQAYAKHGPPRPLRYNYDAESMGTKMMWTWVECMREPGCGRA